MNPLSTWLLQIAFNFGQFLRAFVNLAIDRLPADAKPFCQNCWWHPLGRWTVEGLGVSERAAANRGGISRVPADFFKRRAQ